ncbi:MAG: flippase-like domain-containing protein [Dysgonamonadaceae bacterium]|nr:flippase-like domain-containing protein [Dysgonamonadaceae bacterium]
MKEKIKSGLIKFSKTFIPLAFGLIVLWFIVKALDFEQVILILKKDVNYWIIALSLPFGLFGQIMRAIRWELLIRPLGYNPKKSNLIYSVLGNYGVNLAFPRLGEIWRCTMINRYEKVPFTKLIGTVIIDRISDTIVVAMIVIAAFVMNVPYFKSFFAQHPETYSKLYDILSSVWFYIGIVFMGIVMWFFFRQFKERPAIKKTQQFLFDIWEGIRTIGRMKDNWLFGFYSLLIWLSYFLYFYICFYAFPFTENLGWNCGLIAFGMGSIAMGVPVQGGVGAWQFMIIATLIGFGLTKDDAGAFAFCVWTIQSLIFTALFGLFGVMALPIANSKKINK